MIRLLKPNSLSRFALARTRLNSRVTTTAGLRYFSSDIKEIKDEADTNESDRSATTTGVLDQSNNETVLYYDHVYSPDSSIRQYVRWLISPIQGQTSIEGLRKTVQDISGPLPENAVITDLVPLRRDCGAFVKFQVPPETSVKDFVVQIKNNVKKHEDEYNSNIFRRVFNIVYSHYPAVFSVKGTPWIEDLRRFPSPKLKVIFEGEALTEEELYMLFRRYGIIADIIPGKEFATLVFSKVRSAISAKNCVTGITLNKGGTTLHLQYLPIKRVNYITDFVGQHPRIAIPILIALLATFAVLIFDPIRERSIEQKITKKYSIITYKDNKYVQILYIPYNTVRRWLSSSYQYLDSQLHVFDKNEKNGSSGESTVGTLWDERFEMSKQLKLWIYENINTYIIVKGPKGSGKQEFVLDHTLNRDSELKNKVLYINCDSLSKSRSDTALIKNTSTQLGYFPVFTWTSSISQFIDLGVQGMTGQKSGLSESKETQIKNMFSLTTSAIRKVALGDYAKYKSAIDKKNSKLPDGEEQIKLLREDEYLQQYPEVKPVIVVSNYARKSDTHSNDFIYPMIAEWTSSLIQNNLAHVIFITSDVGSVQHLNDSLPNQVFKTITLSDASSANAKQYLIDQLQIKDAAKVESCLEPLGGRMLDLQAFIRRINSGESPLEAIDEMVYQAAEQITTFFLNNHKFESDAIDNNWIPAQIWVIMKLLSKSEEINFDQLVTSPLFSKGSETLSTLSTLEKFDLITLKRDKGILTKITKGRPLFKAAFKNLIEDAKIYRMYEIDLLENLVKIENEKIQKLEKELISISAIGGKVDNRINYLSKKIEGSSSNVINYEEKIAEIKKSGKGESKSFLGIF